MSHAIKDRTLVFTLPKGVRVKPIDFLPALSQVNGLFEGFGTVGVSHIWHMTFIDQASHDLILSQGSFTILDGVHVVVSKLSDGFHTAQLHWLPFWIPHSDVEQSLSILLGDKVTCTYIRIPQKGFEGCFSTQRSIQSPANLAKLPYFVNIVSEGVLHKSCLFVPGRPQICFKCHLTGHMKSSCKAENITQAIANPVKPDEEENSEQSSDESQMVDEKDIPDSYMISINHESYIQVQGQDCVITPPDYSDLTDYDFCIANLKCNKKTHSCGLISLWLRGRVSHRRMQEHFDMDHGDFFLEKC